MILKLLVHSNNKCIELDSFAVMQGWSRLCLCSALARTCLCYDQKLGLPNMLHNFM